MWNQSFVRTVVLQLLTVILLLFALFVAAKHYRGVINYLGQPDEMASEASTPPDATSASTELWTPSLKPGEKPNLQQILQEARNLREQRRHEDSLQRHIWYHNHALEHDRGVSGVRLSFALSDWVELARRYPRAKQALLEIRDRKTRDLSEGRGFFELFMDVNAINRALSDDESTYALFNVVRQKDPELARQSYIVVEELLVRKGDYELCLEFIGDPLRKFDSIHNNWKGLKRFEQQRAGSPNPPPPLADRNFVKQTRQLIEILVANKRRPDAEQILTQALSVLDNAQLKSAIADAEQKLTKRN